jgi:hypothetical protein
MTIKHRAERGKWRSTLCLTLMLGAQQFQQLRAVRRYPPNLVACEQIGY